MKSASFQIIHTAYEFRLDQKKYPLEEIYKAASLAGFRDKKTTGAQVELLSHKSPVIRYWAAIGLRSQDPENIRQYSKNIMKAVEDPYLPCSSDGLICFIRVGRQ
jgi:hypothetical protein